MKDVIQTSSTSGPKLCLPRVVLTIDDRRHLTFKRKLPDYIMVNSLAVAAAFCASASAFMAPTPLARTAAPQRGGVSLGVLEFLFGMFILFCGSCWIPACPPNPWP